MCIYCCTFIQLNDYWKQMFGLVIDKTYYISNYILNKFTCIIYEL